MIIDRVNIKKFRGFNNVDLQLGNQLTIITGQNGTQKTTLLGLLTQPFTITENTNPMYSEKPLCGGTYKSAFKDKFKLSPNFDKAKTHEWSLILNDEPEPFVIESIQRDAKKYPSEIRFWKKGDRSKGSGYIQMPVIYLSLKRLLPLGEDNNITKSSKIVLNPSEQLLYKELHNEILISLDKIETAEYLESQNKNTIGVNTDTYDWMQNSAGQDNVGKIILSLLSFMRLKETYPTFYKGGILAIDEIDATMYPASQTKLLNVLRKYSSKLDIQIIFTTHSLSLIEKAYELQTELSKKQATKNQIKVVFLEKKDNNVHVINESTFDTIKCRLNVTLNKLKTKKIEVYTEDSEAALFAKALLGRTYSMKLKFIDVTMSCSALVDLAYRKIPHFSFPTSIIILDGDVKQDKAQFKKIAKSQNVLILPSETSPERVLANFLYNLSDMDDLWVKINSNFNKQFCFQNYSITEINNHRTKAKDWWKYIINNTSKASLNKIIHRWEQDNMEICKGFKDEFIKKYNNFAKELNIDKI